MPFGAIRPAIGPSLLKSHLEGIGVSSRIVYLNMRFARLLGEQDYEHLAERMPAQSLAGDWVFSSCLFGKRSHADAAWVEAFAKRFAKYLRTKSALDVLKRARDLADLYLEDCLEEVDWGAYDVIGFTSTFCQHVASLALARRLKERDPRLLVAFGGGNCEGEMGLQLHRSFPFVDFVCSGEADLSFPRLIQALIQGGDIAEISGVIFRRDGQSRCKTLTPERVRDLDTLPYPNYDDYFEQRMELWPTTTRPAGVLMESSRGCWWGEKHHCIFCGLNGMSMAFRSKSAERVLDEIVALNERYQPSFIAMVDNILDMHYFRDLLPQLENLEPDLQLFYETKANLTKDQVRMLRDAHVRTIQPGIESLSTDILRIMRKGTTAIQNIQLLKWCKEFCVEAQWNLLYGFPGENPADYKKTVDIIPWISHLKPPANIAVIRLDRFSPNFVSGDELGISNIRPDRSYRYVYALPERDLVHFAYYFEHDYSDGRDPESYVGEAHRAVRRWQRDSAGRGLVFTDHGEMIAILDFREGAREILTILSRHERALYLYCDQHRSRKMIDAFVAELGPTDLDVEESLARLVGSRLMIELDGRYLSLAVPVSPKLHDEAPLEPPAPSCTHGATDPRRECDTQVTRLALLRKGHGAVATSR
jgi:ribosomal peptide maturation radical SAM protein 1